VLAVVVGADVVVLVGSWVVLEVASGVLAVFVVGCACVDVGLVPSSLFGVLVDPALAVEDAIVLLEVVLVASGALSVVGVATSVAVACELLTVPLVSGLSVEVTNFVLEAAAVEVPDEEEEVAPDMAVEALVEEEKDAIGPVLVGA
jgi:hypothetical protein